MKFSLFFIAEYANMVTASALITSLFFGGWDIPFTQWDNLPPFTVLKTVLTLGAFLTKVLFFLFFFMWIRWTLPRFRYDQLMKLGWRVLLPASLANILLTGVVWLALDKAGVAASDGLRVAADVSQAAVAVAIAYALVRGVAGFFAPVRHHRDVIGTSAVRSASGGGTKAEAMQA
jgi:NADH-quinone oxidoreductase subunit H